MLSSLGNRHYISSIIRELIQLFLEGWREYFYSFWFVSPQLAARLSHVSICRNLLEIGAFVSYILGFMLHAHCTVDNDDCRHIAFAADM